MSPTRLFLLAALTGTAGVPVMHAQTPADLAGADSVTPAPAKHGGGLFGALKKVAHNNPASNAVGAVRDSAVRDKMIKRAQSGTQPTDMQACVRMWEQK